MTRRQTSQINSGKSQNKLTANTITVTFKGIGDMNCTVAILYYLKCPIFNSEKNNTYNKTRQYGPYNGKEVSRKKELEEAIYWSY